ncbi:hypothetical protein FRUB_05974 [Fimbriiglobus ruber]|uniref:Uncharacterized protein n=1 Tax=Fimbriiglobus ruber TaxID=1908690 RepID=A0A225DCZ2_9BACT|nr:hypothetical protein FRUB_05974 [Fimbriiglobus ruber]
MGRLEHSARTRPPADALHIITVLRVEDDPDGRPAGVYTYPSGTSVDLVHNEPEPEPHTLRSLTDRLAPWGLVISRDPT